MRASPGEWVQAALLTGNLGWTTLCLGGYRPETMVVSSALTIALLAVHLVIRATEKRSVSLHPAGWWLLPFLVYAAANVIWVTPVRWLGWLDWFGWAQMIAVFWVVLNGIRSPGPRFGLYLGLIAIAIVAVLLGCYQRFVDPDWLMLGRVQAEQFQGRASGPFGIPNSFAALLLLLLPSCGALLWRSGATATERVWWGWVTLVLAFGLVLTISRGAWIGLALALSVWPLCHAGWNLRRRAVMAVTVLAVVTMAAGLVYAISPKVRERFIALVIEGGERSRPIMWRASWQLFREAPVAGTGAGSYNVLFEKHRPERFREEPQWTHNDYLNTLSDYGALGALLFFGACVAIAMAAWPRNPSRDPVVRVRRHAFEDPLIRAALGIGILAFGFQLFVDFHFKIPALAMIFATVAALAVRRPEAHPDGEAQSPAAAVRIGWGVLALAVLGLGGAFVVPKYHAEGLRYRARQSIDQLALQRPEGQEFGNRLAVVQSMLESAATWDPANGQIWAELSYATALEAHVHSGTDGEFGRKAERLAERALALSIVCPEFWIRRGVARDMQARWLEAGNDFTQALTLAPTQALVWYYHADHLSRNRVTRGMAEAALAFCLRLDPANPEGLALRQRLAISPRSP